MLNLRSTSCPDVGRPRSYKQGTSQNLTFCLILEKELKHSNTRRRGKHLVHVHVCYRRTRMRLVEQASRRGTKPPNRAGKNPATLDPFDPDRAPCLYHFTAALVVVCRARTCHIRHREILDPEENPNGRAKYILKKTEDKDASTNATEPERTSDASAWQDLADVPWKIRSAYAAVVWLAVPKAAIRFTVHYHWTRLYLCRCSSSCTVSNVVEFRYTGTTAVKVAAEPVHVLAQCYDGSSSV
ncbi:hypothetical protein NEUTE2DRAFT_125127 [Neurospora tetrasperma FGSC 2509]|nr:hypothetical protein NEUTE2DRAFT_125127 [Neurospora tetrasperma FGSC 2509]